MPKEKIATFPWGVDLERFSTGKYPPGEINKFAIISRGFKSEYENKNVKVKPYHKVKEIGDEAKLLKKKFPEQDIYIGKNRKISIQKAIQDKNKIIILDDGFQTTNIFKDIKIMLFNPEHPYYYLRNFKFLAKNEDFIFFFKELSKDLKKYRK